MASIQCKLEIPKVEGLKDDELTVGREAHLLCDGEFPKELQVNKLHFVEASEQKYLIKLLKTNFTSSTQADFTITSYVAGNIRWPDLQMTDDAQAFSLGPMNLHVESVLPKPEAAAQGAPQTGGQAKVEPYGPIGPANLAVPPMYWMILLAVVVAISTLVIFRLIRRVQRRNMIQRLREHDSALAPLTQFHQSLRRLQRANPAFFGGNTAAEDVHGAMGELRQMLLLFITRKYQIPALEWKTRLILRDIKKYHRGVYVECGTDLQTLLKEFQHAAENKQSVIGSDLVNLAKRTRHLVEQMESLT